MTSSRSRASETATRTEPDAAEDVDETPQLNVREIHSERTVFTEEANTDGWIATDLTVALTE